MSLLINEAMRLERERHLGVSPFERSPKRRGYGNGFKARTAKSRVGARNRAVPQVRAGGFYPQSLDKGLRSERALKLALAQMVVTGVSTRKIMRRVLASISRKEDPGDVSTLANPEVVEKIRQTSAWLLLTDGQTGSFVNTLAIREF